MKNDFVELQEIYEGNSSQYRDFGPSSNMKYSPDPAGPGLTLGNNSKNLPNDVCCTSTRYIKRVCKKTLKLTSKPIYNIARGWTIKSK